MEKKAEYSPFALYAVGGILITAGWMMGSFPISIFFGFAPLFALTDRTEGSTSLFEKMEGVLFALALSFLAGGSFNFTYAAEAVLTAIIFTLAFIGHVWVRRTLGRRAGKITIIFFWLALEYVLVKVVPERGVFLADALRGQESWQRWNIYTGYLGGSLWILMVNLLVYQVFLSRQPFAAIWIILTVCFLVGPILCSSAMGTVPLTKEEMISVYTGKPDVRDVAYLARTELVVRTAAWLSTLIILFTFVKSRTSK